MIRQKLIEQAIRYGEEAAVALHQIPEHSFQEYKTTELVRNVCERCKADILDIGMETGVVAWLNCQKKDTVALRADIDAVPTDHGPLHLCGHDYHTASLLGAMEVLCKLKEELPYNVVFFFQPAEECTSGAAAMLKHGLLEKLPQRPIRLFGIHNRPEIPSGSIGVHTGYLMAEKTNFKIQFLGKTGHGGNPHLCIDPLVAASQFVVAVQTVISRNVDPQEAAVCSVCSFHSGTEENFAPEKATLTGSLRSFSHEVHLRMRERVDQLARQIAAGFDCECHIDWIPEVPAIYNSPEMFEIARRAAEKTVGAQKIVDPVPCLGSEDFAVFGEKIPSFFYWVGSGRPDGASHAWHHMAFQVEKPYLSVAIPLLVHSAMEE